MKKAKIIRIFKLHQLMVRRTSLMEKAKIMRILKLLSKKGPTKCDSDSGSVKIIDFSSHFSPYQSHMDWELSEELLDMRKKKKRSVALANWDWDSVVDLGSSQDEESESELSDTADSAKPAKKVPRITIHRRNRVLKLIDESSEDE